MKIELKRQVAVDAFATLLDVGIPRDEYRAFLPALMLGEENDITSSIINTKLFFTDANDPRGRLLLERLKEYRLVEENGTIIDEGDDNEDATNDEYSLTEDGYRILPYLKRHYVSDFGPGVIETVKSLAESGLFEVDSYSGDYMTTEECRAIGNWSWPKVPVTTRERENLFIFKKLGLVKTKKQKNNRSASQSREACKYSLTVTGKAAIQDKMVFIPERDGFLLHGTDDPLFHEPVLACVKTNDSTNDPKSKKKPEGMQKSPREMQWITTVKERVERDPQLVHLATEQNRTVQLIEIVESGEQADPLFSITAKLSIDENEGAILTVYSKNHVKKTDSGKGLTVGHEFTLPFIKVLRNLFRGSSDDIIETVDGCAHLVSYRDIANDATALNSHKKDFRIEKPEIDGFGKFDDVTLQALPIIPKTVNDAQQWAVWTLRESIRYYTNETGYAELRESAARSWEPHYSHEEILESLPSYDEMRIALEDGRNSDPERYWYIAAPFLLTIKEVE